MIAEVAKCCLNSSLYVFHGNYCTKQIYRDYPGNCTSYCYFLKPIVYDLNLYQNDDILLTYSATVLNGPKVSILTPKLVTALVKIDSKSGKTIWAKQIYSFYGNIFLAVYQTYIVNDISWSLLTPDIPPGPMPSEIRKIDSNGVILDAFYVMNSQYPNYSKEYKLYVYKFLLLPDSSMVLQAKTLYLEGEFGISSSSNIDFTFFKLDSNRDFVWSTSIDYFHGVEVTNSMIFKNKTLYIGLTTSLYYFCLITLDSDTGKFQKSQCIYTKYNDTDDRRLNIDYISDQYIFADITEKVTSRKSYFYIFDSNSLTLLKSYTYMNYFNFAGFGTDDNKTQIIFSERMNLYTYTFDNQLNIEAKMNYMQWKNYDLGYPLFSI